MNERRPSYMKATREELQLIRELTSEPVFQRLDKGDLAIVDDSDWSDVPQIEQPQEGEAVIRVSSSLYGELEAASEREATSPEELASRWLEEKLAVAHHAG